MFDNVEIINEDILKIDINSLIEKNNEKTAKIVANLPYYITTPIIMKLLEEKGNLASITVMVQKEVADRLCAKTGTREAGAITYAVEYYSNAKKIVKVPNNSFIPMPNVESAVIQLEVIKNKFDNVKNQEKLFNIIKYAFMQRRKTLTNALQNLGESKEKIQNILSELKIDEKIRGEALTLEEFIKISNLL